MTDIEAAKAALPGHSIALCRDGSVITDDGRGISPMIRFITEGRELSGWSAADIIVGKAAAMLFVKAGISEVYAETLSAAGKAFLEARGIPYSYGTLTEMIINREGTGQCPMEEAVAGINDTEKAFAVLTKRLEEMRARAAEKAAQMK